MCVCVCVDECASVFCIVCVTVTDCVFLCCVQQKEKEETLMLEMQFGSKPCTPVKQKSSKSVNNVHTINYVYVTVK